MSLRTKCAVLLIAFELTLAATLMMTVAYIGIYFDDAADTFSASSAGMADVGRLRTLARTELAHAVRFAGHPEAADEGERLNQAIDAAAGALLADIAPRLRPGEADELRGLVSARQRSVADHLALACAAGPGQPPPRFNSAAHVALDALLGRLESRLLDDVRATVETTFVAQRRAALILSANMLVGAALGILGLVLVRRWVLLPLQELKEVTDEIGRGNLQRRARVASRDEMGLLAGALNKMSADLARIERQMVQRERLAAMGELMSYVAHNIRNPLAGIRGLAEACRRRLGDRADLRGHHDEIVAAIDRFQRWLRELEHTCSPLEVRAEPVDLREIVDNVVTVFRPMAERRSISIERANGSGAHVVKLDARHFEQALAAVVGNAVEAVGDHGRVTIGVEHAPGEDQWSLFVADTGPGIPAEVRDKVFEPSFSTKKSGHGLGLALARRVVELHGGQISVECPPRRGTVFHISMPAEPSARLSHG
jgi:signal transduction histidine kinase